MNQIDCSSFYNEYRGHKESHIKLLINEFKKDHKNIIYLAGDSSLDNKFWLDSSDYEDAVNGYQYILSPPKMKTDIAYHFNKLLEESDSNYCVINTSIEESTLADRKYNLLTQDKIIQENITCDDILIVSIGGNDIALKPSVSTMTNMASLICLNTNTMLSSGPDSSWGMTYFINMFKSDVENYIKKMIGDKKPKKIIVCMIYYPDEKGSGSWADRTLNLLGYNKNPDKLKLIIHQIFKYGTSEIRIPGCDIVPFPMFNVLDGKNTNDYIQRVEPSALGGLKLATAFKKILFKNTVV